MRLWIAALLAACSSGGGRDRCERAFDKMASLGAFGGDSYGTAETEDGIALGMACGDLTKDDFACLDAAKRPDDLERCAHAQGVIDAERQHLLVSGNDGPPADPADFASLADAVCRCRDVGCLVAVGEREHDQLERIVTSGTPTDAASTATRDEIRDCIARLRDVPAAATRRDPDDDDYAGKLHFFADQMCACTTAACAKAVEQTMTEWGTKASRNNKPDDATVKAVEADQERMMQCEMKLSP